MSEKESLLVKPSRPLDTSLKWRSVLILHDLWSPSLHVEGLGHCPYVTDGYTSIGGGRAAMAIDRGLVPGSR